MGFFHFRIKTYIEIRVADSVPIEKALGCVALIKGIVYSNDNLDILEKELADINTIDSINQAIEEIEKKGFDVAIYHGKTVGTWADYLITLAEKGLDNNDKEYRDMLPLLKSI